MLSSGTAAVATTTADETTLIANADKQTYRRAVVTTAVVGFASFDGGNTWHRLAVGRNDFDLDRAPSRKPVTIKRDGATDMTGVYGSAW